MPLSHDPEAAMRRQIAFLEGQVALETEAVQLAYAKLKKLRFAITYERCTCEPGYYLEEHYIDKVTCLRCRLLEIIGE